jgi:hypothetical protein
LYHLNFSFPIITSIFMVFLFKFHITLFSYKVLAVTMAFSRLG